MSNPNPAQYDVLIVGAGIAGSALAHALSTAGTGNGKKPLRIALLERSLSQPDRIVGELLQPGGISALHTLGLSSCVDDIDAIPVHGYCVAHSGQVVHIPYPGRYQGRSFHHGRFVMKLRERAREGTGVDVIEATAVELVECARTGGVVGVKARAGGGEERTYNAKLVVVADGCFSNFRTQIMGPAGTVKPSMRSYFVGAILENAVLPIPQHGTVALVRGHGPALFYQIGPRDTRMLIDIKHPLPQDINAHILTQVMPHLPESLHVPIQNALAKDRLRRMPNSFLPAVQQGRSSSKPGVILLGDAWNMRHPLTGGGMTVALNDVVILRDLLSHVHDLSNPSEITQVLRTWHWKRKPLAATVNILSVALYDLFGADDENLDVLKVGCFRYFERGGECVRGPVSLLAAITPSPVLLFNHFFAVAFYSIYVMFTQHQGAWYLYPQLVIKAFRVFWTACIVFGPLLWSEVRWWAP